MNAFRNSVHLIGRSGSDPEIKNGGNYKLAKFRFATDNYYRNEKNETVKETSWYNIVAWDKTAESVEKLIKKGKLIALEGKLRINIWEDKEKVKHSTIEITLNDFFLIDWVNENNEVGSQ